MIKGAYKRKSVRIVEDEPPKMDYDELRRLSVKYKLQELAYQIGKLNDKKEALEKMYNELEQTVQ